MTNTTPEPPPLPSEHNERKHASQRSEPPPLPSDCDAPNTPKALIEKSKIFAKQFVATAQSAAKLTAKQAQRTKIQNVSLPQAFAALGRHVHSTEAFRNAFAEAFHELDEIHTKIELLETRAKSRPAGEKITDKAKAVAASTKDRTEAYTYRLQISRRMAKLGQAVFDTHGKASGPVELVSPIEQLLIRRDVLTQEIDALSSEGKGSWVTPKRLAIGSIVGVAGLAMIFLVHSVSSSDAQKSSASLQRAKAGLTNQSSGPSNVQKSSASLQPAERFESSGHIIPAIDGSGEDKVLTTEYYPHAPGSTRYLEKLVRIGSTHDMVHLTQVDHLANGVVATSWIACYGQPGYIKVPLPKPKTGYYRQENGFIEIGWEVEFVGGIVWEPIVKLGAKEGDTWTRVIASSPSSYTLKEFKYTEKETLPGGRALCAVIEKVTEHGVTETTLAKGIGPIEEVYWIVNNGKKLLKNTEMLKKFEPH